MKGWIKVHMYSGEDEWIQVSKIRCVWDAGVGRGMIEYSNEEKEEVKENMDEIMEKIAEAI